MIYEFIAFSSCVMSLAPASIITNLQLEINRFKRENDKQKWFYFIFVNESEQNVVVVYVVVV